MGNNSLEKLISNEYSKKVARDINYWLKDAEESTKERVIRTLNEDYVIKFVKDFGDNAYGIAYNIARIARYTDEETIDEIINIIYKRYKTEMVTSTRDLVEIYKGIKEFVEREDIGNAMMRDLGIKNKFFWNDTKIFLWYLMEVIEGIKNRDTVEFFMRVFEKYGPGISKDVLLSFDNILERTKDVEGIREDIKYLSDYINQLDGIDFMHAVYKYLNKKYKT